MRLDYDTFHAMPWGERVRAFDALFPAEKAELVRTHIARWLETHRGELTAEQIEVVEAAIDIATPELYAVRKSDEVVASLNAMVARTSALLSREQMREALTLHW